MLYTIRYCIRTSFLLAGINNGIDYKVANVKNYKNLCVSYFLAEKADLNQISGYQEEYRKRYYLDYIKNRILLFFLNID